MTCGTIIGAIIGKHINKPTFNTSILKLNFLIIILLASLSISCEKKPKTPEYNNLTFTLYREPGFTSLGENFVTYNEIIGYDSSTHVFLLTENTKARIQDTPNRAFAVAVDGVQIYKVNLIPGYTSASCNQCIRMEPFSLNNK